MPTGVVPRIVVAIKDVLPPACSNFCLARVALAPCVMRVLHPETYSGKLEATTLTVYVKDHWIWPTIVLILSSLVARHINRWRTVLFPLAKARRDLGDFGPVLAKLDDRFDGTAYAIRNSFNKDVYTLYAEVDLAGHDDALIPAKLEDYKERAGILHGVPAAWTAFKTERASLSAAVELLTSLPPGASTGWGEVVTSLLSGRPLSVTELPTVKANLERATLAAHAFTDFDYKTVSDQFTTWKGEQPPSRDVDFRERLGAMGDALALLNLRLNARPPYDLLTYPEGLRTDVSKAQSAYVQAKYARRVAFTEAVDEGVTDTPKSEPVGESQLTGTYVVADSQVRRWSFALLGLGVILSVVAGLKSEYFGHATFGAGWDYVTLVAYGLGVQSLTELIFGAVNALTLRARAA